MSAIKVKQDRARYSVKPAGAGTTHVYHQGQKVASVEQVHTYPEFVRNAFGRKVKNADNKKFLTRYAVTELANFSPEGAHFRTAKAACQAAAAFHHNNKKLLEIHPVHTIADRIASLGHAIHAAAADHRLSEQDQERLLQISKGHASLRETFDMQFADHLNNNNKQN